MNNDVRVIHNEPIIQVARPGGYTNYSLTDAKVLRDNLTTAVREAEGLHKEAPVLRVGARVRRTSKVIAGMSRYAYGTEATVSVVLNGGAEVQTPFGQAVWNTAYFDVIG